jgi:23S rRNA pseudouridine1911/1915/1917 synthase
MTEQLVVLYEDNHCLVVAKPAPLLTQGVPPGIPTLESMAKAYLKERYHKAGNVYLGIPHRLDRPVSGVVLFARNTKAAQRLAEQFQKHQVTKVYWAVVEGVVEPSEGQWSDWLLKLPEEALSKRVSPDTPGARRALLDYQKLGAGPGLTFLDVRPQTGRMHQIRVQAGERGWPVLGDILYGAKQSFGPAASLPRERVIALHARSLTFLHPIRFEPITVTAPLPEYWKQLPIEPKPTTSEW